jgi:hypothetical protein
VVSRPLIKMCLLPGEELGTIRLATVGTKEEGGVLVFVDPYRKLFDTLATMGTQGPCMTWSVARHMYPMGFCVRFLFQLFHALSTSYNTLLLLLHVL